MPDFRGGAGDQEEQIERVWTCDGSDEQTERTLARILDFAVACGDGPDSGDDAPAQPTKRTKLENIGADTTGDGGEPSSAAVQNPATDTTESVADGLPWACTACTFVNDKPVALACEICGTTRLWQQQGQQQ